MSQQNMTRVVAALIERKGQILICRRRPDQDHPNKWEFPGGKVERNETLRQALTRELQEELGIDVKPGHQITYYTYQYPESEAIELNFFHVEDVDQEIDVTQFSDVHWVSIDKLPSFDFLAGDVKFVQEFVRGEFRKPGM